MIITISIKTTERYQEASMKTNNLTSSKGRVSNTIKNVSNTSINPRHLFKIYKHLKHHSNPLAPSSTAVLLLTFSRLHNTFQARWRDSHHIRSSHHIKNKWQLSQANNPKRNFTIVQFATDSYKQTTTTNVNTVSPKIIRGFKTANQATPRLSSKCKMLQRQPHCISKAKIIGRVSPTLSTKLEISRE